MSRYTRLDKFYGDPNRVAPFVAEMSRFLSEFGHSSDYDGYLYALTQIHGPARIAVENRTRDLPSSSLSWDMVAMWLLAEFQSPAVQLNARRELRSLRQTGLLQDYTSMFRGIDYKLPYMSDADKQFAYREGLAEALANALAPYGDFPSLQDLITFTANLDAQLRAGTRSSQTHISAFQARPNSKGDLTCFVCGSNQHKLPEKAKELAATPLTEQITDAVILTWPTCTDFRQEG